MRILIALRQPSLGGGVRSHVETVASEMQRVGHDVVVFSLDEFAWRDELEAVGLRTAGSLKGLSGRFDVAIAHDRPSVHDINAELPELPVAFVWHGNFYDVDMSPQLDGAVKLIFQPYGPDKTRAAGISVKVPTVQVRQPIELNKRFTPHGPIAERPRRAISLSGYTTDTRRAVLVEACERAGIELELWGANEELGATRTPEIAINRADIVFGKGRVVMEAMACGRAAFVYDEFGTDGFVTEENIDELLASGIAGTDTPMPATADRIVEELARYDQRMGMVNRDLARHLFRVSAHVATQISALEQLLADNPPAAHNDASFELARLSRVAWAFEGEAHVMAHRLKQVSVSREAWRSEAEELARELERITTSRRWKLTGMLARPLDRLRGRG
ncbi:MAG: hypothetical protein QM648_10290 [Solirubrobacterales bacterium]